MPAKLLLRLAGAAAALLLAASAAGGEGVFQIRQIHIGDQSVTVMIYQGQSYRLIAADDLADAKLSGQTVCLEGKLKSAGLDGAQIHGVEEKFAIAAPEIFRGYNPGDNVWLGGRLDRVENKPVFKIAKAVRLKSDLELFEERYEAAAQAGDWKRLLDLAGWIERSRGYNPNIPYEEHAKYRKCSNRAITKARSCAEVAFGEENAEGYVELAGMLFKVGDENETAYRYLQRAAAIDPELQSATRRLVEAGFVRVMGRYVTVEEKKAIEAAEAVRAKRSRAEALDRLERAAQAAVAGAASYTRTSYELETAVAALKPAEAATRLASEIEINNSDPRLARRALALSFGLPLKMQGAALAVAARSPVDSVRMAALELAAARKDLEGRKVVKEAATHDSVEEVVELACKLLAAAADADSMGLLVELASSDNETRKRAAGQALRATTREDRYTKAEWDKWWKRTKESFPAGPTE